MMKKILSFILAGVMLLGIFAMGVSAETTGVQWKEYKLLLDDGVALKFVFEGLNEGDERTIRLESELGTKDFTVTADKNGEIFAIWDDLNPTQFGMGVTATVLEDNVVSKGAKSVVGYCQGIINTRAYSDELHAIAVDLLNYAEAVKQWEADRDGDSEVNFIGRELNAAEIEKMKAITIGLYGKAGSFNTIASLVCEKLNLTFSTKITANSLIDLFNSNDAGSTTLKDRSEIAEVNRMAYDMIVPNSWGGELFADGYSNALTAESFKPGDMVLMRKEEGFTAPFWTLVYIGDGIFACWTTNSQNDRSYVTMDLFLNTIMAGGGYKGYKNLAAEDLEAAGNVVYFEGTISYYAVFRPSQVLPNFETVVAPEVGDYDFFATQATGGLNQIVTPDQTDAQVIFGTAMPILGESIGYRFYVSGALDGAKFKGKLADGEVVDLPVKNNTNGSYVDFTDLTPADLYKVVTVYAVDAEGAPLSIEKQFCGASYAAWVFDGDTYGRSGKLKDLVSAMMVYANGAKNYVDSDYNDYYTYKSISTKGATSIKAVTNMELIKYRIEGIPDELLLASAGHAKNMLKSVYNAVGVDATMIISGGSNSAVDTETGVAGSLAQICRVNFLRDSTNKIASIGKFDALSQLEVGDLIVSAGTPPSWVTEAGADKAWPGSNPNYVYLGNGRFLRSTNGATGANASHIVYMELFDNPATEAVEDILDLSAKWSRIFIIRPSNVLENN